MQPRREPEILCQMSYSAFHPAHDKLQDAFNRGDLIVRNGVFDSIGPWEPPISTEPVTGVYKAVTKLGPGVRGYTFLQGNEIIIPFLIAEYQGSGDVGRFLDRLSRRCVIMTVISKRLEGMLVRRGWNKTIVVSADGASEDYWRRSRA